MSARVAWRRYRRTFRAPLHVSGHTWTRREGIIVRLERQDDSVGFGEIAPVPWFPVECLDDAEAFLQTMGHGQARPPSHLPCTAFALSAAEQDRPTFSEGEELPTAALLPAGEPALEALTTKLGDGCRTFKWKIGVHETETEWAVAKQIGAILQGQGRLRLDANGGLTVAQLKGWAQALAGLPIDYVEQPLPVGMEQETAEVCRATGLPYAFDESACTLISLRRLSTLYPDAVYVVKPSQSGTTTDLAQFLKTHPDIQRVFSWAFETPIGFAAVHVFSKELPSLGAPGFGSQDVFEEDVFSVLSPQLKIRELEALWKQL